jgi:hypothetical protein
VPLVFYAFVAICCVLSVEWLGAAVRGNQNSSYPATHTLLLSVQSLLHPYILPL